jgi:hypothetical protein
MGLAVAACYGRQRQNLSSSRVGSHVCGFVLVLLCVQVDCFDNLADWRQLGLILSE